MNLLFDIRRYLDHTATAETTFGRRVLNDSRFVRDLRAGRTVSPRIEAVVRAHLQGKGTPQ